MAVGGRYWAENRGPCWAAELRERVGNGGQGSRAQVLLFLKTPAEGDKGMSFFLPQNQQITEQGKV